MANFIPLPLPLNIKQADTGTKMIHVGKNTKSTIVSQGISAGHGQNTYRGLVRVQKNASGAMVEHEASTSKISEDRLFYARQRGISQEDAIL